MIRYRTGIDEKTGRPLTGRAHLEQSIAKIIMTIPTERVMRLDFGMDPTRQLGRNISARLAATLYREMITAIHKWEPEYRVRRLQLVNIDRTGALGVLFEGDYFPQGRLGDYSIVQPANINLPLALSDMRGAA